MAHVLIIDDDATAPALRDALVADGHRCMLATSLRQGQLQRALQAPDWLIVAEQLPDGSGMAMLASLADEADAGIRVVMISAQATVAAAVAAFRGGAADYLERPIDLRRLKVVLASNARGVLGEGRGSGWGDRRFDGVNTTATRTTTMRTTATGTPAAGAVAGGSASAPVLLGESAPMRTLRDHIQRVSPTEASVLLLGESGTGKELVAQSIHAHSVRRHQPFLPVNCGAISPQLIESEIFGHEKGSFTGADRQHKGYFERACGGTLFLDEVVEMPIELQVKLLRVLETGSFMRIGSNQELQTDVRIVAATNRDPEHAIAAGRLRLDLYHRLNVFPLRIPALRERGTDIALLAQHFLDDFNRMHGTQKSLSPRALSVMGSYHWPGNVRELRNFMQRAYILSEQQIDTHALEPGPAQCEATALTLAIPVGTSLADADRRLIFATLDLCGGVKKRAADLLGISLKTLYNRLEEYGHQDRARAIGRLGHGLAMTDSITDTPTSVPVSIPASIPAPMSPAVPQAAPQAVPPPIPPSMPPPAHADFTALGSMQPPIAAGAGGLLN